MRCFMQMNVSVPPAIYELVQNKVKSGMYSNASEVVRDALRMLDQKQREATSWEKLGELLTKAKDGGRSSLTVDDIVNEVINKQGK